MNYCGIQLACIYIYPNIYKYIYTHIKATACIYIHAVGFSIVIIRCYTVQCKTISLVSDSRSAFLSMLQFCLPLPILYEQSAHRNAYHNRQQRTQQGAGNASNMSNRWLSWNRFTLHHCTKYLILCRQCIVLVEVDLEDIQHVYKKHIY